MVPVAMSAMDKLRNNVLLGKFTLAMARIKIKRPVKPIAEVIFCVVEMALGASP